MEGDDKNVLKLLKREGRKDVSLCTTALQYFVMKNTEGKGKDGDENNAVNGAVKGGGGGGGMNKVGTDDSDESGSEDDSESDER
jgi:hypothetical protein